MNHPIRILLVDDSPHFLRAAREFLHLQQTFTVAGSATEGPDALIQAQQLQPDLILLDLNLGTQSGLELIPLFRTLMPGTKIIVLTSMDDEAYRTAALQAGADAFVRKTEMARSLVSVILGLTDASAKDQNPSGTA